MKKSMISWLIEERSHHEGIVGCIFMSLTLWNLICRDVYTRVAVLKASYVEG